MAIDILTLEPNKISRDLRSKYILLAGAPKNFGPLNGDI